MVDGVSWQCDKNVFSKRDVHRSDKCTVLANESHIPFVPPSAGNAVLWNAHERSTMEWEDWHREELAIFNKVSMPYKAIFCDKRNGHNTCYAQWRDRKVVVVEGH